MTKPTKTPTETTAEQAPPQDAQAALAAGMLEVYAQRLAVATHENVALAVQLQAAQALIAQLSGSAVENPAA